MISDEKTYNEDASSERLSGDTGLSEEISFEVTDSLPGWSRPSPPANETGWELAEGPFFYIDADVSRGWPYRSKTALCKIGVTSKSPAVRCRENEEALRRKWDIEADLEVVFVATGHITTAEKEIADYTLPWLPGRFQKNAEWRECPPRELARIAVLIAEQRFRSGLS